MRVEDTGQPVGRNQRIPPATATATTSVPRHRRRVSSRLAKTCEVSGTARASPATQDGYRLEASACSVQSSDELAGPRRTSRHFGLKPGDWSLKPHDAEAEEIFAGSEDMRG
jgi:hypothetical protein